MQEHNGEPMMPPPPSEPPLSSHQRKERMLISLVNVLEPRTEFFRRVNKNKIDKLSEFITRAAYESGLEKEVVYENLTFPGIKMLQRNSFIDEVQFDFNKKKQMPGTRRVFLKLDIENLRGADLAGAADYMLGTVAQKIQSQKELFNPQLAPRSIGVHTGRYGGDEFVLALVGNYKDDDITNLQKALLLEISSLPGYYKFGNNPVVEGKIGIKNNAVEVIKPPENDSLAEMIFNYYLERGDLLSAEKLKHEKDRFETPEAFIKYTSENIVPFDYPKEVATTDQKIAYMKRVNPEFADYFTYADELSSKSERMRKELLEFIESNIADRLLGRAVGTFTAMKDRLKNNEFSAMWGYDIKFIKEINDHLSYSEADDVIRSVWQSIDKAISDKDKGKLFIARRGGTFVVGLRAGESLTVETVSQLNNIQAVTYPGEAFQIPLGSTKNTIEELNKVAVTQQGRHEGDLLYAITNLAEENFYIKIIRRIRNYGIDNVLPSPESSLVEDFNLQWLIYEFFTGSKRNFERITKAISIIGNKQNFNPDQYNNIRYRLISYHAYELVKKLEALQIEEDTAKKIAQVQSELLTG